MTVDVDYGFGHVIYDVDASEAFTDPTSSIVQGRGTAVYNHLLTLDQSATHAAEEALGRIEELKNFSASVRAVTFDVPAVPTPSLDAVPAVPRLNLKDIDVREAGLDTTFDYALEQAVSAAWATPEPVQHYTPDLPAMTADYPLPNTPSEYVLPAAAPPTVVVPVFTPDALTAPVLEQVVIDVSDVLDIEEFVLDVDTETLLSAIESMRNFDPVAPELPEYTYLIPEIFEVTGSMAAGNTIVQYQQLLDNRTGLLGGTAPATAHSFNRRRLHVPDGAAVYDSWLDGILHRKLRDSDTVFEAVAIDDCVRTAFELCTAAHRLLVDIEVGLYDLEFALAKAAVNAQVEKARIVSAIYRAELLLLQTAIAQYNATAANVRARAQIFEANARQAAIIGEMNSVTADLFTAEESVKGVDADVYKAQVMAEKAKLQMYKAVMDSYKAAAANAAASAAAFSGKAAKYSAEVERISTGYDTYVATAQSAQFSNASRAASLQAKQSELRSVAALADSSAASASAKAIELQARAAVRETPYIARALGNDEKAMDLRIAGSDYDTLISEYIVELQQRGVDLSNKSAVGQMISRYVQSAQEAVGRAAQLSQTANVRLAEAYQTVYEAAGKAGAAVASGKLSGFRASATLGAGESLRASNSYSVGYSGRGTNSFSEDISLSESIGV